MSDNEHMIEQDGANQAPVQVLEIRESLCAMVDGEIQTQEMTLTVSQAETQDWVAYHLIGEVMRKSDALTPVSQTFAARMSAALERESVHRPEIAIAPEAQHPSVETSPTQNGWRRWFSLPTLAITAAVASVVWIVQPMIGDSIGTVSPVQNLQASSHSVQPLPKVAIDDYLDAHRQLAGPISVQMASYVPGVGQ